MSTTDASAEFLSLQSVVAGRYSLESEIGRGGMGIVFLARDVALDRPVAIKLLPPTLAAEPELRRRFVQEARTAAGLSHPNIVPIHAVEEHGALVFFVMTFVEGETLRQRVERTGPLRPSETVRVIQEVAWALTLAHTKGIVHRDVKPDNILIDKTTGRALVTDFGIARVAEAEEVTAKGELIGTVHYMSPEQASGEAVDGRSDLYSLGATAFFALTGRVPFEAPSAIAVAVKHIEEPAPPVASLRTGVPDKLAAVVDRCLAKDPTVRFQSGEELAEAIDTAKIGEIPVALSIRLFQAAANSLGAESVAYVTVIFLMSGWTSTAAITQLALDGARSTLFIMLGLYWVWRLDRLHLRARRILSEGFDFEEVRRAFLLDVGVRARDRENAPTSAEGLLGKLRRALTQRRTLRVFRPSTLRVFRPSIPELTAAGIMILVLGSFLDSFLPWYFPPDGFDPFRPLKPNPISVIIVRSIVVAGLGTVLASLLPFGRGRRQRRLLPFWSAIWSGPVGRWFFRIAGLGLRRVGIRVTPSAEPTETLIADAADAVFARLPAQDRRRLSDVPAVIHRLQEHVEALRERREHLGRVQAVSGAADLKAATQAVSERLATAVAALENLRLDLLRLSIGQASIDDLTADLERAREIGREIDRLLEGQREVVEMLEAEKMIPR